MAGRKYLADSQWSDTVAQFMEGMNDTGMQQNRKAANAP